MLVCGKVNKYPHETQYISINNFEVKLLSKLYGL